MTISFAQQFSIKPPSKDELARRLTGGRAAGVQPAPVLKSTAPVEFFRKTESVRNQIVPSSYMLGANGGLAGFGSAFGALSGDMIVPGVDFNHVWGMEDLTMTTQRARNWLTEVSGAPRGLEFPPYNYGYIPTSATVLKIARDAWKTLQALAAPRDGGEPGNLAAAAELNRLEGILKKAALEVDATWDFVRFGIASRAPDIEERRTDALKKIVAALQEIPVVTAKIKKADDAAMLIAAKAKAEEEASGGGAFLPPTSTGNAQADAIANARRADALRGAAQAQAQAQAQAAAAAAAAKVKLEEEALANSQSKTSLGGSSMPKLPLLIGGGVLLAGAAFMLLRKKK